MLTIRALCELVLYHASLDDANFPTAIHINQMLDGSQLETPFPHFALNDHIRQLLHSSGIKYDVLCLMERLAQVLLYDLCLVRFRSFYFPDQPIYDHICGRGSVLFAATDELHGHARHSKRLGRLVFVRPDVEVWRDDDLSSRLFHDAHYTASMAAILKKKERALGFIA